MSLDYKVVYGWCNTESHKDGFEIREDFTRSDYVFDKNYRAFTEEAFDNLSLPFPDVDVVYRGTSHDMLFLNSHGLVVRIGPADVEKMINPYLLQPIGWYADTKYTVGNKRMNLIDNYEKFPLGVSVYPGVDLISKKFRDVARAMSACSDLAYNIRHTGQNSQEVNINNAGIITIDSGESSERRILVQLDVDNHYNGPRGGITSRREYQLYKNSEELDNKADAIDVTLKGIYAPHVSKDYIDGVEVHQPLRHKFWEACYNGDKFTPGRLKPLWDECAEILLNGAKEMSLPVFSNDNSFLKEKNVKVYLNNPWIHAENKLEIKF